MTGEAWTQDSFLGGRLLIAQPKSGFRAGHDTVLLAAAVPAHEGSRVLELGSGAGVASLCLASRVPGVEVLGVEIDAELVAHANESAARNAMATRIRFACGDAVAVPGADEFDHVFFNPPFHPRTGQESANPTRTRAMRDPENAVEAWTRTALRLVKPGGTVTAIVRADRVPKVLAVGGDGIVFPLFPHAGEAPKRAIVQFVKGGTAPLRTSSGLILHEADGRNTEAAEAVLRHGAALRLG